MDASGDVDPIGMKIGFKLVMIVLLDIEFLFNSIIDHFRWRGEWHGTTGKLHWVYFGGIRLIDGFQSCGSNSFIANNLQ